MACAAATTESGKDAAEVEEGQEPGEVFNTQAQIERIQALIEEGGGDGKKISDLLKKIEKGAGATSSKSDAVLKALRKRSGAKTVGVELDLDREVTKTDLELLSIAARKGRSSVLSLDLSSLPLSLPTPLQTLRLLVAEQEAAKGEFPGPCPLLARIPSKVTSLQVAEVAAAGVKGVVFAAAPHDDGELRALCQACSAVGTSAIVEVCSTTEVASAIEAGAKGVCVRGVASVEDAIALHSSIPKDVVALTAIPSQQKGGQEVEDFRELMRGAPYDGVLMMGAAEVGEDDGYLTYVLDTLQSKKSSQYSFGAMGTSGEPDAPDSKYMPAAVEAKKKNPRAWAKAQREAKSIVSDYRRGKRSLKTD